MKRLLPVVFIVSIFAIATEGVVLFPSSGDVWMECQRFRISWFIISQYKNWEIDLYTQDGVFREKIESSINDDFYNWDVPYSIPAGRWKIRITNTINSEYSEVFNIVDPTKTFVTVWTTLSSTQAGGSFLVYWKTCGW